MFRRHIVFLCMMTTMLFLATGIVIHAQDRPSLPGDQEEPIIKAGEVFKFTVHLDKAPASSDGKITYRRTVMINAGVSGDYQEFCTSTVPGQHDYVCSLQTDKSLIGNLDVDILSVQVEYPDKVVSVSTKPKRFRIVGKPARPLVVEGGEIRIDLNLSQVQLLRTAAAQLQNQIQTFKAALVPYKENANGVVSQIVRVNIEDAVASLRRTQTSINMLASAAAPRPRAEKVFFDDLRTSYEEVLSQLDQGQIQTRPTAASISLFLIERAQTSKPDLGYPIVAQAAFRSFEQNELAYNIVADTQSYTFDLSVRSNPAGATVCYHRRGDPCRLNPDDTNTTIKSLPYAIWLVQFKKYGYKTEEIEHDPFREANHVIDVELRQQGTR